MNPQENEEDIIELDQPNEINDDMLQQLHKAGQEMAKIVDDTISALFEISIVKSQIAI